MKRIASLVFTALGVSFESCSPKPGEGKRQREHGAGGVVTHGCGDTRAGAHVVTSGGHARDLVEKRFGQRTQLVGPAVDRVVAIDDGKESLRRQLRLRRPLHLHRRGHPHHGPSLRRPQFPHHRRTSHRTGVREDRYPTRRPGLFRCTQ